MVALKRERGAVESVTRKGADGQRVGAKSQKTTTATAGGSSRLSGCKRLKFFRLAISKSKKNKMFKKAVKVLAVFYCIAGAESPAPF